MSNLLSPSPAVNLPIASAPLAEITQLHGEIMAAARMSLDKAIRIGELLAAIKDGLRHGDWLPWIKANAPFAERTARNYIQVFENRDRLKSATVADLGDAYRLLAPPPNRASGPMTAPQLVREAAKAFLKGRDALESEDLSPEQAALVLRTLDGAAALAKRLLQTPSDMPFLDLLLILMVCTEARDSVERGAAA